MERDLVLVHVLSVITFEKQKDPQIRTIILQEEGSDRALPIETDAITGNAILLEIRGEESPSVTIWDLAKEFFDAFGSVLSRVIITDADEKIFYAEVHINREVFEDVRAADAVALAVRCNAPIYAARELIEIASRRVEEKEGVIHLLVDSKPKQAKALPVSDLERLKEEQRKAIEEERYEDAARLKKKIEALGKNRK